MVNLNELLTPLLEEAGLKADRSGNPPKDCWRKEGLLVVEVRDQEVALRQVVDGVMHLDLRQATLKMRILKGQKPFPDFETINMADPAAFDLLRKKLEIIKRAAVMVTRPDGSSWR